MNVLGLVQLMEVSAVPTAGYFLGAQRMLARGPVAGELALESLVDIALASAIGPAEGVASGIVYRCARGGDLSQVPTVCGVLAARPLPPEMRQSSLQIGQKLWDASRHWQWAQTVHDQLDRLVDERQLPHAVALGALVSETTSSQVRAIATYLFHVARSIVMAGVQLIPLPEPSGARVLSRAQERIVRLAADLADKTPADIGAR
jgi:urease accessory protein UreF